MVDVEAGRRRHDGAVVVRKPTAAGQAAAGADGGRVDRLVDEDLGAGVVGRIVAGVPVAELVAAVAVAGLGGHGQAGDGFGQGQGFRGVG